MGKIKEARCFRLPRLNEIRLDSTRLYTLKDRLQRFGLQRKWTFDVGGYEDGIFQNC